MSYIQRVLQPGETVLCQTRLHWLVFMRAIFAFFLAAGCLGALGFTTDEPHDALEIAAAVLAVIGAVSWASAAIRRASTELAVTDHRVIFKRGFIARHTVEISRSKVESVDVEQTVVGRLFGYGTVAVHGTGGTFEPVRFIEDPLAFRSAITAT